MSMAAKLRWSGRPSATSAASRIIPAPARALRHGWVVLLNVAKALAAVGAFALPFAAVALPFVLAWRLWRPRRLAR